MESSCLERKLTDIKGYSRLMADDEAVTVQTLTAYRDLMAAQIRQHGLPTSPS
jgi:class 3 adenylate cyclase